MTMQQIAAVASPSVVAITTEQMSSSQTWFGGYYVQSGAGSGVIISEDGYILTNNHVISGADKITVYVNPGDGSEEKSYEATLIGSSESKRHRGAQDRRDRPECRGLRRQRSA